MMPEGCAKPNQPVGSLEFCILEMLDANAGSHAKKNENEPAKALMFEALKQ